MALTADQIFAVNNLVSAGLTNLYAQSKKELDDKIDEVKMMVQGAKTELETKMIAGSALQEEIKEYVIKTRVELDGTMEKMKGMDEVKKQLDMTTEASQRLLGQVATHESDLMN